MRRRVWVSIGIGAMILAGALLHVWSALRTSPLSVPSFQSVRAAHRPSDARLLDRTGEPVHEVRIDSKARRLHWVSLAEISPALTGAVLASEDRRFYQHGGVDGRALAAATLQWITGGPRRGASTISMQVASVLSAPIGFLPAPPGLTPLPLARSIRFLSRANGFPGLLLNERARPMAGQGDRQPLSPRQPNRRIPGRHIPKPQQDAILYVIIVSLELHDGSILSVPFSLKVSSNGRGNDAHYNSHLVLSSDGPIVNNFIFFLTIRLYDHKTMRPIINDTPACRYAGAS